MASQTAARLDAFLSPAKAGLMCAWGILYLPAMAKAIAFAGGSGKLDCRGGSGVRGYLALGLGFERVKFFLDLCQGILVATGICGGP